MSAERYPVTRRDASTRKATRAAEIAQVLQVEQLMNAVRDGRYSIAQFIPRQVEPFHSCQVLVNVVVLREFTHDPAT